MSESRAVANEYEGHKRDSTDHFQQFLNGCRRQRVNKVGELKIVNAMKLILYISGKKRDWCFYLLVFFGSSLNSH